MDGHGTWVPAVGEGARLGVRPPPPENEKKLQLIHPYGGGGPFSLCEDLFATFFSLWGPFFAMWGLFLLLF